MSQAHWHIREHMKMSAPEVWGLPDLIPQLYADCRTVYVWSFGEQERWEQTQQGISGL